MPSSDRQSRALNWLFPDDTEWGTRAGEFDAELAEKVLGRVGRLFGDRRYFPVEAHGLDALPEAPVLMVANHSGGSSIPDAWGLMYLWHTHFRFQRIVHALAHEMVMGTRLTGPFFSRLGILRAAPDRARTVLRDWRRDLLVMPGGDRDTWRPYKDRYRVHFAGRTGYARLALETGVPVVPIAHAGAHETLVVLTDGAEIARRLRLQEFFRIGVFPVHISLPWGLGIGPLPHIPVPARLRYHFGAPVALPDDVDPDHVTDSQVEAYDVRVRSALQQGLDTLRANANRTER